MSEVMSNIEYTLASGWVDSVTGLPQHHANGTPKFLHGSTFPRVYDPKITEVVLCFEDLMPFLREDLTPAERKQQNFVIASTLLHEICVRLIDQQAKDH